MERTEQKVKINWIEFENLSTGLKIERVEFFKNITLLVGLSGVGKTQILEAVEYSLNLPVRNDIILRPYAVTMSVSIGNNNYEWSYCIDKDTTQDLLLEHNDKSDGYIITHESLLKNGETIFKKTLDEIFVVGYTKVPQPKKDESLLLQYSEDEAFEELISGIKKLHSLEMDLEIHRGIHRDGFNKIKAFIDETITRDPQTSFKKFSKLPVTFKLHTIKKYYNDLYVKIFEAVKELFMEIEDIDVVEDKVKEVYCVAITVYGKQLLQHDISNGMLKTIYYLVELFTMSEDSLVLIDEFENGLGVNCIDLLSEILWTERDDLQFIVTSHHPKIINGIDQSNWKIIDRNIDVVTNRSASQYGIGVSQHDAYFNLINRWEFEGKI